jgi:hypothetical protein
MTEEFHKTINPFVYEQSSEYQINRQLGKTNSDRWFQVIVFACLLVLMLGAFTLGYIVHR